MDLVRYELLPPSLVRDMQREASQRALAAHAAPPNDRRGLALASRLGAALVLAGCRLQEAGRRLAAVSPGVAAAPCGCSV